MIFPTLLFTTGCLLIGGAGFYLVIWTRAHPRSEMPDSILLAPTWWTIIRKYFLLPLTCATIGFLCILLSIFSLWGK